MKIYTVQRMDKYDYDFSVLLQNRGCFINKEDAKRKAKLVYKDMCDEYAEDILKYKYEKVMYNNSTLLEIEEDHENGYYRISFGDSDDYECHSVAVDEHELNGKDEDTIYRKVKREYLIEDIKEKAEDMEYDLTGVDMERLADRAEKTLGNNDSMYESYWMSIEYTIENI